MAIQVINKESSLWGWSRIIAIGTAMGSFAAVSMGQPDAAPDLGDLSNAGVEVIDAGYFLYAKVLSFVSVGMVTYSKIRSMFN